MDVVPRLTKRKPKSGKVVAKMKPKKLRKMHRPGLEPGPTDLQASTLDQWTTLKSYMTYEHSKIFRHRNRSDSFQSLIRIMEFTVFEAAHLGRIVERKRTRPARGWDPGCVVQAGTWEPGDFHSGMKRELAVAANYVIVQWLVPGKDGARENSLVRGDESGELAPTHLTCTSTTIDLAKRSL